MRHVPVALALRGRTGARSVIAPTIIAPVSRQVRGALLGIDSHDHLDLNRDVQRQLRHPDRGSGVTSYLFAEHLNELRRATVDHGRRVREP